MEIEHASDDNDVSFPPNPLGIIAQVSGDSDDELMTVQYREVLDDDSFFSPVEGRGCGTVGSGVGAVQYAFLLDCSSLSMVIP
ncbi:hypothetical protein LIER_00497 [Lithospermum erythrorhizon]|uniref:Uncharacterized protein n=1 Tax=Lithospermum erythrorhizon TaxID=34254 RepID=A0AAV3NIU5_LITER